jgi:hypothetical protein
MRSNDFLNEPIDPKLYKLAADAPERFPDDAEESEVNDDEFGDDEDDDEAEDDEEDEEIKDEDE